MSEPNSPGDHEGKNNGREVTDPVTHLPILIHDNTSVELERIPPHPSREKDPETQKPGGEEGSNERHAAMEQVVTDETHRGRWSDPGDAENRMKIRTAIVAAGSAGIGGMGGLLLMWFWSRAFGRSNFRWFDLFFATLGCTILAIGVGACVVVFGGSDSFDNAAPHGREMVNEKVCMIFKQPVTIQSYYLASLPHTRSPPKIKGKMHPNQRHGSIRSSTPYGLSSTQLSSRPSQTCSKTRSKPPFPR